jgi:hypothetical protein
LVLYEAYRRDLHYNLKPDEEGKKAVSRFLGKYAVQTGLMAGVIFVLFSSSESAPSGDTVIRVLIALPGVAAMWWNWQRGGTP